MSNYEVKSIKQGKIAIQNTQYAQRSTENGEPSTKEVTEIILEFARLFE